MTTLIWATDYVIMSKLNTNNRPRNMFTPCLHSSDAWNEFGAMHFISSALCIFTHQASTRRYRACVIRRLYIPSGPEIIVDVPLPGLIIELIQPAVGYIAYIYCLVQFIFNSDDSPSKTFSNILMNFFFFVVFLFGHPMLTLLFYCHS